MRWSRELSRIYWVEVAKFRKGIAGEDSYVGLLTFIASLALFITAVSFSQVTSLAMSPALWVVMGYALCFVPSYLNAKVFRRKFDQYLCTRPLVEGCFSKDGILAITEAGRYEYSWTNVRNIVASDTGFVVLLLGDAMLPVLAEDLPEGLTQQEALELISEWRAA
ncbi:hypothetical protein [Halovulum sp. GXIMD14793]